MMKVSDRSQPLNRVIYMSDEERGRLISRLRDEAEATPEYQDLKQKEVEADAAKRAHWVALKAECLKRFEERLASRPEAGDMFQDLSDDDRQRVAENIFMEEVRETLPLDAGENLFRAETALRCFIIEYLDQNLPECNPFTDEANRRRDHLVTPEFQRWFADSKVVCADGAPLVAFHGTDADVMVFKTGDDALLADPHAKVLQKLDYTGPMGAWFTAPSLYQANYDAGNAEATAESFIVGRDIEYRDGSNVMPVYLAIRNPKEFGDYDDYQDERSSYRTLHAFKQKMLADGFDGFVIRNCETDGNCDRDDWVAFDPKQIKSAIGNNGAFDPENPSLTDQAPRYMVLSIRDMNTVAFADLGCGVELACIVEECARGDIGRIVGTRLLDTNGNQVGEISHCDFVAGAASDGAVKIVIETDAVSSELLTNVAASLARGEGNSPVVDNSGKVVGSIISGQWPIFDKCQAVEMALEIELEL